LYLFDTEISQWLHHGTGDIRILQPQDLEKNDTIHESRVVMRREDVLNLAINHLITPHMDISDHGKNSIKYSAIDFSHPDDGDEGYKKTLAVRFKSTNDMDNFKSKVADILQKIETRKTATKHIPTEIPAAVDNEKAQSEAPATEARSSVPPSEKSTLDTELPSNGDHLDANPAKS